MYIKGIQNFAYMNRGKFMAKKQMKKGVKATLIVISIILSLVAVLGVVFGIILKKEEIPTFSFSGYVYADGEALSGAKVSCGVIQTETNEDGYYKFDKLTRVVEVTVSKDNYIFGSDLVFVNSNKENVNFSGFELFSLNGVVMNGDVVVPYAEIEVISETGIYKTQANAFGAFSLPRLAGEVTLNAYHDNISLFSQVFNKSKTELVVSGTTSLVGKITCDSESDYDFILKLNDEIISLNEDLTFNIDNVEPNSTLTLTSENYYIANNEILVSIENGEFEFVAEKYYDINGVVLSGQTPLHNARIVIGKAKTYTNSLGEFTVYNQHGDLSISTSLQGYTFENINVNNENNVVEIEGVFPLKGKVSTDDNSLANIEIVSGDKSTTTNAKGEFLLNEMQLGDVVSVNDSNYFISKNNIVVSDLSSISFELFKLYDLNICVEYLNIPLAGVEVILGNKSYTTDADGKIIVPKLYGINNAELSFDGYKFQNSYMSDYMHSTLKITPYKYYNLSGKVMSGENVIEGAIISTMDNEVVTNELGEFVITDLYLDGNFQVTATNFNSQTIEYSINNNQFDINLTYDVSGVVQCGGMVVDNVLVTLGEQTTYTNYSGEFKLSGLTGNNEISFSKSYYSIDNVIVSSGESLEVPSTYSIQGKVSNKIGVIEGLEISLISNSDSTITIKTTTNENGNFEFQGLAGQYLLIYDGDYSETLLPSSYTIDCGGVYNFADSGYKIQGRVMTGDIPVGGVTITAGDLVAVTNAQGYYKFDLIIDDTTLVLSKEGYTFENNNLDVDMSFENSDVDFSCTYEIEGVVASGNTNIGGVKVIAGEFECLTNDDGYYYISGLSGSVSLLSELEGYTFSTPTTISANGVYNISAMFSSNILIKTGDVPVENVEISINGESYFTDEDGNALVNNIQIGDNLILTKEGFEFTPYQFTARESSVSLQCSYSVKGNVFIVSKYLSSVHVTCGDESVITGDDGYFEFNNLTGINTLAFTKDNYSFDDITVSEYNNFNVFAKYSVTGCIIVAGYGLEGVLVSAGESQVYTDINGYYTLSALQEEYTLEFEKYGYEFYGEFIVNSPSTINVEATFRVSGVVRSGEIEIEGAEVILSNGVTVTTDENGYFEIKGIDEVVDIEVVASGYNSSIISNIDKFNNDLKFNLTYNVTINLSNITNLTDVAISISGNINKYSQSQIVLENLTGSQTIEIYKEGYNFSPNKVVPTASTTYNIVVKKEFAITGKITTTGGTAVAGVTIIANNKQTITDANGNYSLSPFIDPTKVSLKMSVIDTAFNGENYEYEIDLDQVSTDAVVNYSLSSSEYSYFLYKQGYQKLNDANSYQIFGEGTVADSSTNKSQDISIVYKKDTQNRRIIQNLNWYNGKIFTVEPRIAQLTYIEMDKSVDVNKRLVQYQTITGEAVSKGTATWVTSWTKTTYSDYLTNYGVNVEGYHPYIINKSTISSISEITLDDGLYSFQLTLNEASYAYYKTQMGKMCSSQTFKSFGYCNITYTIGQDGYIRTMVISEKYQVDAMGGLATPDVTASITYNFLTTSSNEVINDIKVGTVDEIKKSLAKETPTYITPTSINLVNYDVYCEKRRILV